MMDSEITIRRQSARFRVSGTRRRPCVILLYPDKLAVVASRATLWGCFLGPVVLIGIYPLVHEIGTLGGAVGVMLGAWIGDAMGKVLAAGKMARRADAGDGVTVIPLDSITRLQVRESTWIENNWLGLLDLLVTTADGAEYEFRGGRMARWQADLASALTVRGSEVHATPHGMTVAADRA